MHFNLFDIIAEIFFLEFYRRSSRIKCKKKKNKLLKINKINLKKKKKVDIHTYSTLLVIDKLKKQIFQTR